MLLSLLDAKYTFPEELAKYISSGQVAPTAQEPAQSTGLPVVHLPTHLVVRESCGAGINTRARYF